ncbi:MAG: ATP-binding protein [Nitrospirae bacterium]|nr:ATP-binding protein [Nitrospirota bacterium]MCL5238613.1 ATP-binding protein [Nitrospirota bacterium]
MNELTIIPDEIITSKKNRGMFVSGIAALYALVFLVLYRTVGEHIVALTAVPIAAAGVSMGLRAGMLAWFISIPLNMVLFYIVGEPGWEIITHRWPGVLVGMATGAGFGWVSEITKKVKGQALELEREREILAQQIQVRREIEEELRSRRLDLEKAVLEAQLRQSQKMEAVGQLAGGIAHDFNNILTAIISLGKLLEMRLDRSSTLHMYASQIIVSAGKAARLTRSLLAFSRKQIIDSRPVRINGVIKGLERLVLRVMSEDIESKITCSDEDLMVMADPVQIEQVLLNLASNAKDAMPDGGTLYISTGRFDMDEDYTRRHGFGAPGSYAVISVSDTGTGMDERVRSKIFEPFFTTKELGRGTGLGLAIVYGIVKQHNGYINVYSEPDNGTTFRIYLPAINTGDEEVSPVPPV